MRLWSLHPRYLDSRGLVALWREALLAQAVLAGQTRGYTRHPQLNRFQACAAPSRAIAAYLRIVHEEAERRGYRFDAGKIGVGAHPETLPLTLGQLQYEWQHLEAKLRQRAPDWLASLPRHAPPSHHPLFHVVPGDVAEWEVVQPA